MNSGISLCSVLAVAVVLGGASGCLSGWGAFTESLLTDVCPALTSKISGLVKGHSIETPGPITPDIVSESLKCGRELAKASKRRGAQLIRNGVNLAGCSPALLHFFSTKLPADVKSVAEKSHEILTATKIMQMRLCGDAECTPNTFLSFLEHQVIRLNDISYCKPYSITCKKSAKFRTIDGSCNNLKHPAWGRSIAPFTRIAKPKYADGIFAMPVARSGRALPNARVLSTRLFQDAQMNSRVLSHLNTQWGQFVTHDMVFQVMESTDEGGINCCAGNGNDMLPPEWENDKCIPIRIPDNDAFYSYQGVKCMNFVRSVTAPREDCSLGHAEQMNTVTSFLDGSPIYGSDPKLAKKLRAKSGGRLRTESRPKCTKGFLPMVEDKSSVCVLRNSSDPCYLAGDGRINQTPTLAMLHTLMLREHNRVADILASLNPQWSDERLYQEAKKIVVAEIQHITYQEYLPLNFGENYFRYYRISPVSLYNRDYSDDVNPGIINAFGAAAFRYLHTMVPASIATCPSGYQAVYQHRLSDHYMNPILLEQSPESFDDIVRGILAHSSGESDPYVTGEVTNFLFKCSSAWGLDLIAMDIQRGRDHGLASYNDYREICGLTRARTFQDLAREIPQDRINALQQLYECVDDIDLFVGGSMERDVDGSILGHTFQCIVAEQFYRTRVGDRFFYDNGEMAHSFTPDQLKEIKKASMARLICDNTDGVQFIQRKAFEVESAYNPKCRCDDYSAIPYVDLTPWKKGIFDLSD
ncbi:hypothetical protein JYU34_004307 [Plutella xylostella]|uniref:Peroxidase n=1 Tax=Plutella xylostella TaxID=51655 RepID=A0ABQ7QXN2_PLUXY|nr:hypothetical protein JYU34_004307 [Plutella xylostella]